MKRTKLFFVPVDDHVLILEMDEKATKQLEAGAEIMSLAVRVREVDYATVITLENGKVTSIAM